MSAATSFDVVVVGAGLAGLAAAHALSADGARVAVLERRPEIAGRAYSYPHPALDEIVDSQHVVLGCCTNLLDLCGRSGAAANIRWYDEMTFLEPNGNRSIMRSSGLPAPSHQTLSLLQAPMLSLTDKLGIARGMMEFLRGYPGEDRESFAQWLKRTKQTERAIRHFWEPVVVGALNDGFDACSVKYAGKVFHESFLRSPEAGRLGIPAAPLSEFFAPVLDSVRAAGADVRFKAGVQRLEALPDDRWRVHGSDGNVLEAGAIVLAVNLQQARELWAASALPVDADSQRWLSPEGSNEVRFVSAPITTIHLWYDREISELDHAVLLDTRIQWLFHKSRIRRWAPERGSYAELVISASWPELKMGREAILADALRELELFFPKVREAKLLKSGVLKEARATFSVVPGLDALRPAQKTGVPGIFLAGDWTATEWPSTMEGAVRSGRLAAGAVADEPDRYMSAELPATGLMQWLSKVG